MLIIVGGRVVVPTLYLAIIVYIHVLHGCPAAISARLRLLVNKCGIQLLHEAGL